MNTVFQSMSGVILRKTLLSACKIPQGHSFWVEAGARAEEIHEDIHYWDGITILQAFATSGEILHHSSFSTLSKRILHHISELSPKHLLDFLAVLNYLKVQPTHYAKTILSAIVDKLPQMYGEEISQTISLLARLQTEKETVNRVFENIYFDNLRPLHYCLIAGSLSQFKIQDKSFQKTLECRFEKEIAMCSNEQLKATITGLSFNQFSWKPFEILVYNDFVDSFLRISALPQSDFLDLLCVLRVRSLLSDSLLKKFLNSATKVLQNQLGSNPVFAILYACKVARQRHLFLLNVTDIIDAISEGEYQIQNKIEPLKYEDQRGYVRNKDESPIRVTYCGDKEAGSKRKSPKLIYAKKLPAWRRFSRPWYYNR